MKTLAQLPHGWGQSVPHLYVADHFEDMRAMVSPAPFGNNASFNGGAV